MKVCKDCKQEKDTSEFYGGQGECKECTKKRVRLREQKLRLNPNFVESERVRSREKYHRLNYKDKHKPTPKMKKEQIKRFNLKYPEKVICKNKTSHLKPLVKGNHLHHWSYNVEHAKDVIELNPKDHAKIHRVLKYNQKTFMYKDLNGNLLYTKEKHLDYINNAIEFLND